MYTVLYYTVVYYLSYSEEEENLDESVVVLDDDEDEEIDEGIVRLCTYRTRFSQAFSYILQLRKKRFSVKWSNFKIRNYIQFSVEIRKIVMSLYIWKILTFSLPFYHVKKE